MWVILNHVKADQRANFERFAYERLLPALKKGAAADPILNKLHGQTRMLVPKEANPDGTYTYIWLMDPVVPGADYEYRAILEKKPYPVRGLLSFGSNLLATRPDPQRGIEALRRWSFTRMPIFSRRR